MKILITFPLLILYFLSFSQEDKFSIVTIEFQYGLNAKATTTDEIAQPFLNKRIGKNVGLNFSCFYETKKRRLWEFSGTFGTISHSFSLVNLQYEFDRTYDEDCCVYMPSYIYANIGASRLFKLVDKKKIKTLIGLGLGLNIDISTSGGSFTIGNRRYWDYYDNKRGPALFPNIDLSTRFIYKLTDNFMITSNLAFLYAPFYELDLTYFINSRDGMFEGFFQQKLLGATLSIGIGLSL